MVYLTRHEHFNAAHKLSNPKWSKEKNEQVFGKCANENWHGHNYELMITVKGEVDPETGFIMDAKLLSVLIAEHITEKLDHRNLNLDIDFLKEKCLQNIQRFPDRPVFDDLFIWTFVQNRDFEGAFRQSLFVFVQLLLQA